MIRTASVWSNVWPGARELCQEVDSRTDDRGVAPLAERCVVAFSDRAGEPVRQLRHSGRLRENETVTSVVM